MEERPEKNAVTGGTLYLVATPIGNLADLSPRAQKVLSEVDFVAAEDTRNSGQLLARFRISKPMVSYFEHNKRERGPAIVERLARGESCALVTDAGMPAISDPGEDLVRLCADAGIPVTAIPGSCAAVTALALSGLPTGRFVFEGFLPTAKKDRTARLDALKAEERTIILYEAPHRLRQTLGDLLPDFAVGLYEEREPRGEYVLILGGRPADESGEDYPEDAAAHVALLEASGLSRMDAIKAAAKARGVGKNEIYRLVNLK